MYDRAAMDLVRRRGLFVAAVLILLVALGTTAYPAGWVSDLEAAGTAIRAGRVDLALPALQDAIALEPDISELHFLAAQGALASNDSNQAIESLSLFSADDARVACLVLDATIRAGNFDAALEQLADASCPGRAAPLYEVAELLAAEGEFEEAIRMLETLQRSLPATSEASQTLGTLIALSDPEASLSHLRLAVDLDPQTSLLADELIEVIETARGEANEAYTLAQIGQALARSERWLMAAAAFENALALDPDYTEARAYYGLALDRSGNNGFSELERAVSEAPQAPLPIVLMGKHWLVRGQPTRAVAAYEQAAALAPDDPWIAVDLAAAYAAAGNLPAAKLTYQYAVDLAPNDPTFWSLLAQFSMDYEIELGAIGLPAARRVVMLQPQDADALDQLGYTHFLLGNLKLAERFILEAISADNHLASAQYHLGLLQVSTGDIEGGREAFEFVVTLDPDGRFGNLALRTLENLTP